MCVCAFSEWKVDVKSFINTKKNEQIKNADCFDHLIITFPSFIIFSLFDYYYKNETQETKPILFILNADALRSPQRKLSSTHKLYIMLPEK